LYATAEEADDALLEVRLEVQLACMSEIRFTTVVLSDTILKMVDVELDWKAAVMSTPPGRLELSGLPYSLSS